MSSKAAPCELHWRKTSDESNWTLAKAYSRAHTMARSVAKKDVFLQPLCQAESQSAVLFWVMKGLLHYGPIVIVGEISCGLLWPICQLLCQQHQSHSFCHKVWNWNKEVGCTEIYSLSYSVACFSDHKAQECGQDSRENETYSCILDPCPLLADNNSQRRPVRPIFLNTNQSNDQ